MLCCPGVLGCAIPTCLPAHLRDHPQLPLDNRMKSLDLKPLYWNLRPELEKANSKGLLPTGCLFLHLTFSPWCPQEDGSIFCLLFYHHHWLTDTPSLPAYHSRTQRGRGLPPGEGQGERNAPSSRPAGPSVLLCFIF